MKKKFYISFLRKIYIKNLVNDIHLEKIFDYEKAMIFLNSDSFEVDKETQEYFKGFIPTLITNDKSLNLKYRNVFSEEEFKSYCFDTSGKNNLTSIDSENVFNHFLNIKKNKYKEAYKFTYLETIVDEHNGQEYLTEDTDWETKDWIDTDDELITPL